jgi:hypothetical protein
MPFKGLVEQFFAMERPAERLASRIGELADRGYVLPSIVCPQCGFGAMRPERRAVDRETFQRPVSHAWLRCDRAGCGHSAAASRLAATAA